MNLGGLCDSISNSYSFIFKLMSLNTCNSIFGNCVKACSDNKGFILTCVLHITKDIYDLILHFKMGLNNLTYIELLNGSKLCNFG